MTLTRGTKLTWKDNPFVEVTVSRTSKKGEWADIFVYDNRTRTSYSERLKLPLPSYLEVIN